MTLQPLYIVPLLIEQPTWGGQYISQFKNITQPEVTETRIGQSFELASDSVLTPQLGSAPAYGLASATDIAHPRWLNQPEKLISIQELVQQNPAEVLGQNYLNKHGEQLKILIKFTQAQNNSYQVHVKPGQEFGHWLAKPESWYYLETGKASLGLAPGTDIGEYRARVEAIDTFAQELSQAIREKSLSLEEARRQLAEMIERDHPKRFVNLVTIEPNQVVDLSAGGVHHSWETGPQAPNGNIVYEVQVDVRDEQCTLRSFDQGSIKADGSVRPLTIADYFSALDTTAERNQPQQYLSSPLDSSSTIPSTLFANEYYKTQLVSITDAAPYTQIMADTFNHLFTQSGDVMVRTAQGVWALQKGWSLFVPAGLKEYTLMSSSKAQVLVTSV